MGAIKLLLLLTCVGVALSAVTPASKADAELEAEAEAAGAAQIERALSALTQALGESHEPWTRRLEAARDALAPLLAALESHAATLVLHSQRRLDQLPRALQERLETARVMLAQTQQELVAGATERGAAALEEAAAAVARARDQLASLWPSAPVPASADSNTAGAPPAGH